MPKQHKSRGRREEKKRKRDDTQYEGDSTSKKQKSAETAQAEDYPNDEEFVWFGVLNEEEQEYFRRADELLELNQFNDHEERNLFLANVYREANEKELKIACSQSCSRLMERLIQLSSPSQLKNLFKKFSGNFLNLVKHRFASHCCETLFVQSAPVVTQEIISPVDDQQNIADGDVIVSMENLFLYTLNELEGHIEYLFTDRSASHSIRLLLVVLSGQPLSRPVTASILQSKKKEGVHVAGNESKSAELLIGERVVPSSFQDALSKIISDTLSRLDTTSLRVLATHPLGNPVLQLLLQIELFTLRKARGNDGNSLFRKIVPDMISDQNNEAFSFLNSLLYDPIGSRLMETIVQYAPGKYFRLLYKHCFKEQIGSLSRNEIAGYVAIKVLERLSKEDLQEAVHLIIPQFSSLIERSRMSVIRILIERCTSRGLDTGPIGGAISNAYSIGPGPRILRILCIDLNDVPQEEQRTNPQDAELKANPLKGIRESAKLPAKNEPGQLQGSLLAQLMLSSPGHLSDMIYEDLLALDSRLAGFLARHTNATHVFQCALTAPSSTLEFRRKFIQILYGQIGSLATDLSGSRVVDALWTATRSLSHVRERIATEISRKEEFLRESASGRAVWRNWMMDLFLRRKSQWLNEGRARAGDQRASKAENSSIKADAEKSKIQIAREKFALLKKGVGYSHATSSTAKTTRNRSN
ncbi:MAG: Nucleolar protein 9 [Trizodia sp. TS-e1964]|nr:MAG: Nucleolar protein 9 [Trizodia sp. TS-e1964]